MNRSARKMLLGGAGVAASLVFTTLSGWSMPPAEGGMPPGLMREHVADRLDLSDRQREAVEALFDEARQQSAPDRDRLRQLGDALRADPAAFNATTAREQADELGAITARLAYRMAQTQSQVYALLDERQRVRYGELLALREERRQHRRHWFGAEPR